MQHQGRTVAQSLGRFLAPFLGGRLQSGQHVSDRGQSKHLVYLRLRRELFGCHGASLGQHPTLHRLSVLKRAADQGVPDGLEHAAGQRDIGQLGGHGLWPAQHLPRQAQVFAQAPRAAAQEIATAHIWEQANVGFGHGHLGALGHNPHAGALADAHAATHDDAVHESDIGFAVGVDQVVEAVLFSEKITQRSITCSGCLMKKSDVAARTEGTKRPFFARTAHRHGQHLGIGLPIEQSPGQCPHHVERQSIQCLGAVEGNAANAAFNLRDDIRHCFVSSLTIGSSAKPPGPGNLPTIRSFEALRWLPTRPMRCQTRFRADTAMKLPGL